MIFIRRQTGIKELDDLKTKVHFYEIFSVSSESQILQPKMKSNCSEEFIQRISATVKFEIESYLFDNV